MESYGIHWFRRDLRSRSNPALAWSRREHAGRVVGLFCVDPAILGRADFCPARFLFLLDSLVVLREEFRASGGDLLVVEGGPRRAFSALFEQLKAPGGPRLPATVSFNRDYEPYAIERDREMLRFLGHETGIVPHTERDHLLIEPHELLKDDGTPYKVFTPYAKRWFGKFGTNEIQARLPHAERLPRFTLSWNRLLSSSRRSGASLEDVLERYRGEVRREVHISLPPAGAREGRSVLRRFAAHLGEYHKTRDFPALDATSHLSMFIKNGSLSAAEIISELGLARAKLGKTTGPTAFIRQLVWREFYYSILFHFPQVENSAFIPPLNALDWENREDLFQAWKEGRTGYPIVDAGMRQLRETGWMHNRVRLIVASFLCKDLLIDWRWGASHFMQNLLDGDLAANNGGWQWVASTGVDPQPYFRVFNPILQSRKYDPDGEYIRRWVPELRGLSRRQVHFPGDAAVAAGYPAPIVRHESRVVKALGMYRRTRGTKR